MFKKDALVNLLIGLTIALLPLYSRFTQLDFNRTSKDNLLVVLFGLFGWILGSVSRKRGMSKAMVFSLVYGLFLLVANQWNVLSINVMFYVFYIVSGMMFFGHFFEKHCRETLYYVLYGMVLGATIQSIFAISQFLGFDIYEKIVSLIFEVELIGRESKNIDGSFGNSNLLGAYLCLTIPAFLILKKKVFIILPIIALILSHSVISSLALIGGLVYYTGIIHKCYLYVVASILMFLAYALGMNGYDSGRIEIWNKIFDKVDIHHFWIGKGAGWFADQGIMLSDKVVVQEHNNFIAFFNTFGIAGFLLLLPVFIKFLVSEDKNKIFSSILFIAFLNSFGHFSIHQSTTVMIIIVALAVCLAEGNKDVTSMDRISDPN